MQSDFERSAAKAAVDAVEKRWQRDHDLRQKLKRQNAFRNIMAIVVIALIVLGGLVALDHFGKIDLEFNVDVAGWKRYVEKFIGAGSDSVEQRAYFRNMAAFANAEIWLLKDMPEGVRPRNAAVGYAYYALCQSERQSFDMYKLVVIGNGKLSAYTFLPCSAPRKIEYSDFRKAVGQKPYLLLAEGKVYLSGSKDLRDAEKMRGAIKALAEQ